MRIKSIFENFFVKTKGNMGIKNIKMVMIYTNI